MFALLPAKDNEIDDEDEFLDFGITKDWNIPNIKLTDTEKEQANTWLNNIVNYAGKYEMFNSVFSTIFSYFSNSIFIFQMNQHERNTIEPMKGLYQN